MTPVPSGPADTVELRGGVRMPVLGLGVFRLSRAQTRLAVGTALRAGYRLVDTAAVYGNEQDVAHGVRDTGIGDPVFVTTKVWNDDQGYDATIAACERSRRQLGVETLDLYLVHWPVPAQRRETWRAMEQLLETGRVRAIGVSNYMAHHFEELLKHAEHLPSVNQIELSPYSYRSRRDVLDVCAGAGVTVQAYRPLTGGQFLTDPVLRRLGEELGRSPAQILIRWAVQRGFVPLCRSTDPSRIASNADVFGFSLTEEQMARLDALDRNLVTRGWDPTGVP
ncbi:aldo/keto reductase [Micromonospora sp. DT233]|uniref:aldo/keto reductase n=1 Tax=Micromonospora sp. DT233 TaxID=3393432 RepID=UPI003CF97844